MRLPPIVVVALAAGACTHPGPAVPAAAASGPPTSGYSGFSPSSVVAKSLPAIEAVPLAIPPTVEVEPQPAVAPPDAGPRGPEATIRAVFGVEGDAAVAVARCESTLDPAATNGSHVGLFQLARRWHEGRAAALGFSWEQMFEAGPNVAVAYDLWAEQGWTPWVCQP